MMRSIVLITGAATVLTSVGAIHHHDPKGKMHRHALSNRGVHTSYDHNVVTVVVTKTICMPASATSSSFDASAPSLFISSSSVPASPQASASPSSSAPPPAAKSNIAVIRNHCTYDVYLWSTGDHGDGDCSKKIPAGGTHEEPLRARKQGGVSLKIGKVGAPENDKCRVMNPITQFEYTLGTKKTMDASTGNNELDGTVWYNLSFVDCQKDLDGSECPGWDGGVTGDSGGECRKFICPPGQTCQGEAYFIAENEGLDNGPVGQCEVEHGLTFQLCAHKE
jgi:hypothetical protein